MKKFHYVYVTTNLISSKQYVGDHSTNNLDDNYLGSGGVFRCAIKKYGRNNFEKEILEFFNTKQKAFNAQKKWINKFDTLSPNGYNISPMGGFGVKGFLTEESKKKIGIANKGKQPWLGKKHTIESKKKISDHTNNCGKNNPFYGKKHTEETKLKIKEKLTGKFREPFSAEHKRKISISNKGKHHTNETKELIRLKLKGRIPWNKGKNLKKKAKLFSN
jgi:group I intron endonuclease